MWAPIDHQRASIEHEKTSTENEQAPSRYILPSIEYDDYETVAFHERVDQKRKRREEEDEGEDDKGPPQKLKTTDDLASPSPLALDVSVSDALSSYRPRGPYSLSPRPHWTQELISANSDQELPGPQLPSSQRSESTRQSPRPAVYMSGPYPSHPQSAMEPVTPPSRTASANTAGPSEGGELDPGHVTEIGSPHALRDFLIFPRLEGYRRVADDYGYLDDEDVAGNGNGHAYMGNHGDGPGYSDDVENESPYSMLVDDPHEIPGFAEMEETIFRAVEKFNHQWHHYDPAPWLVEEARISCWGHIVPFGEYDWSRNT